MEKREKKMFVVVSDQHCWGRGGVCGGCAFLLLRVLVWGVLLEDMEKKWGEKYGHFLKIFPTSLQGEIFI